jgi:hypothetical protein
MCTFQNHSGLLPLSPSRYFKDKKPKSLEKNLITKTRRDVSLEITTFMRLRLSFNKLAPRGGLFYFFLIFQESKVAQSLFGKDHLIKGVSVHIGSAQPRTKGGNGGGGGGNGGGNGGGGGGGGGSGGGGGHNREQGHYGGRGGYDYGGASPWASSGGQGGYNRGNGGPSPNRGYYN